MSSKSVSVRAFSVIVAIMVVLAVSLLWAPPQAHATTDVYTNLIPTGASGENLTAKQVNFNGHKWYIIGDYSTSAKEGILTLLAADTSFGRKSWGGAGATDYNTSYIRSHLQSLVDSGEFKSVAHALKDTEYGKLYLLDKAEANRVPLNVRKLFFKGGFMALGYLQYGPWWLREADSASNTVSFVTGNDGAINNSNRQKIPGLDASFGFGIRPALQLDLACVVFDPNTKTFGAKQYSNLFPTDHDRADQLVDKQVNFNGRKWYIIADDLTSPSEGTVTLLSADTSFGVSKFGDTSNDYTSSTVKAYLDGLLYQFDDGGFKSVANVMKETSAGKLYLLSSDEANSVPTSVMKADFTGGDCLKGEWWLRTGVSDGNTLYVWGAIDGYESVGNMGMDAVTKSYGVRPAVQLDMSAVMFLADTKTFVPNVYSSLIPADDDGIDVRDQMVNFNGHKWVILKDESNDPEKKSVTLLSADNSFGARRFDGASTNYASSELKAYLDELTATGEFKNVAFAMKDTGLGKLYLLDLYDCIKEGSHPWAYIMPDEVGKLGFESWWLRTAEGDYCVYAGYTNVKGNWYVDYKNISTDVGVRPALQLDLTAVNYDPETRTFTAHQHDLGYSASGNTITATCKNADHKCKLENCTTTLTIDAPTMTTYGQTGEGISADAVITDEDNIQGNAAVDYYKVLQQQDGEITEVSEKLSGAPTDAGTYVATISMIPNDEASTAYVVYAIGKADNPATVEDAARVTKGGKTIDLASNVALNGASGDVAYTFDGDANGCTLDGSVLKSGATAGTVKVVVTVAEDGNYNAHEGATITVNVSEKDKQTIEVADVEATYGDTDKAVSARVTDPAEGFGQISYAVKPGSEDYIDVDEATGALTIKKVPEGGLAYVTVTAAETASSEVESTEVTVTIAKADAVPPTVQSNGWAADRTERPLVTAEGVETAGGTTLFALGGNATDAPDASAYGETIPTATDFGTYYVWYKVVGDENHNDAEPACVTVDVAAPAAADPGALVCTISSADEWDEFAWKVNNGQTFSGVVVQLTDDITVSSMAGRSDRRFKGTFDGAGHTITFNCDAAEEYAAPFRYVEGAKFHNLKVDGIVTTSNKFAAGFVARSYGNTSFTACHSNITIESSVSGDGTHGGFVAMADAQTTFTDCLFDGSIAGASTTHCGGFVGWPGNNSVTFTNCLNAGGFTSGTEGCGTFSRGDNATTNNSFYHTAYGTAQGTQTDDTGETLRAKLGDGWMVSTVAGEDVVPKRGSLTTLSGNGTSEAPYLISNVEEWNAFEQFVSDGITFDRKVVHLDADIAVSTMAGTNDNRFKGTFDGDGHTITFDCTAAEDYAAPFRYVEGATFKDLTVAGTIQTSGKFAAGIVARSYGSTSLVSCRSKVVIQSATNEDGTHGGLVAIADSEGCHTAFADCLFDGSILGETTTNCGGLLGWPGIRTASFTNCLNAGDFGTKQENGAFSGCGTFSRVYNAANIAIENCYYKAAYGEAQGTQTDEAGEALKNLLGDAWAVSEDGKAGVIPAKSGPAGTDGQADFTYSLTLEDGIDVNFYMEDFEGVLSKFEVSSGTGDDLERVEPEPAGDGRYRYVVAERAAKEMGDAVRVVVKYGGDVIKEGSYSVKGYCQAVIGGDYDAAIPENDRAALKDLCRATLDYGSHAQKEFGYREDALVNGGTDLLESAVGIPEGTYQAKKEGFCAGVDGVTLSLVTTAKTQLVVRFKCAGAADLAGYTATVDGEPVAGPLVPENGKLKVVVPGIAAKDLGEQHAVALAAPDGGGTLTFKVSPVDYMGLAVANNSQLGLNRAFYNYYLKAAAYLGQPAASDGAPDSGNLAAAGATL